MSFQWKIQRGFQMLLMLRNTGSTCQFPFNLQFIIYPGKQQIVVPRKIKLAKCKASIHYLGLVSRSAMPDRYFLDGNTTTISKKM